VLLGRGMAWLDNGTHESMKVASDFIHTIEARQGLKIACPEEIVYRLGYVDAEQLLRLAAPFGQSEYGRYLRQLVEEPDPVRYAAPHPAPRQR
jgi:glucose-1-phosphate thymidylyltransferase